MHGTMLDLHIGLGIGELEFGTVKVFFFLTIFIAFELCPISVSLMPYLLFLQLNCNVAVN